VETPTDTLVTAALAASRAGFVATHQHLFLVGSEGLQRPDAPRRTVQLERMELDSMVAQEPTAPPTRPPRPDWLVLPLKKLQDTFPAMITVGRTANNDIVLADVTISKLHAFFQTTAGQLELCDAGSRNGTFVDGRRLAGRGKGEKVKLGDFVRFGQISLRILDAGGTWDAVQKGLRGRTL
jgi:hypothetical protein